MTAPIIFGIRPSSQDIVAARIKSIFPEGEQLIRAPLSKNALLGLHFQQQPYYASYRLNLPAFMRAASDRVETSLFGEGYGVDIKLSDCMPIPLPDVVVQYESSQGNIPPASHQRICEMGGQKYVFDKKAVYRTSINQIGISALQELESFGKIKTDCKTFTLVNATNFDGVDAHLLITKIFSLFLLTNTYPGFHSDGTDNNKKWMIVFPDPEKEKAAKRKRDEPESSAAGKQPERKKLRSQQQKEKDKTVDDDDMEDEVEELDLLTEDPSRIMLARVPIDRKLGWGGRDEIPKDAGLFFAFFEELADIDRSVTLNVIKTYFAKCLGTTREEIYSQWQFLSQAWFKYNTTLSSKILSHIATGIELALECQAVCFPVFDEKVYTGFVLSGAFFSVHVRGKVYEPKPYEVLLSTFDTMVSHPGLIRELVELYHEAAEEGDPEILTTMPPREMSQRFFLAGMHGETTDVGKFISTKGAGLRFPEKHWGVGLSRLEQFLVAAVEWGREATDRTVPIEYLEQGYPTSYPMATSAMLLGPQRKWYALLSVFGEFAPSPSVPSGLITNIRERVELLDPEVENTLCFYNKPLAEAVKDWEKLERDGVMMNFPKGRAISSKFHTFSGKQRVGLIEAMRTIVRDKVVVVGTSRPVVASVSGGSVRRSLRD